MEFSEGKKYQAYWCGRIAQLVEQLTLNQRVVGSSPTAPTNTIRDSSYQESVRLALGSRVFVLCVSRHAQFLPSFSDLSLNVGIAV
jgi:hypothetical protein